MAKELEDRILIALRRITRAIDLHSRKLATTFGLTGPQLVCLRAIGRHANLTQSALAREVSLSQATITGIVDRLVARQLVARERSTTDRRVVSVCITDAGRKLIETAPHPLQETFLQALGTLDQDEQDSIGSTLERIVGMMQGDDLEAVPVLSTSPAAMPPEEINEPFAGLDDPSTDF